MLPAGRGEDDEKQRRERPRRRRRRPRVARQYGADDGEQERGFFAGFATFERGLVNAGVLGGVIMCVIAVVWLVLGLMVGYLFYYPPVLFVVGVIAIVVGVVNWYKRRWE
ncbi:MAG TPA: hypothetical protein VFA26_09035 [Gemmataceae bacterium]|nr:hypothetical protein [Gemmataceae bacterium]